MQYSDVLVEDIRSVLRDHLHVIADSPEFDLLETGSVDSIGLVELILQLEERFEVSLPMDALEIDDFRTIRSIADLITRLSSVPVHPDARNETPAEAA
jgi:acyl carrier protein